MHVYEVRPRKDKRGVDLISDALPFGRLWYTQISHAVGYAKFYSPSHDVVIRVYDGAGNVIETYNNAGAFKEWWALPRETKSRRAVKRDGSLLRLVEGFSDYSERFAVPVCSVEAGR